MNDILGGIQIRQQAWTWHKNGGNLELLEFNNPVMVWVDFPYSVEEIEAWRLIRCLRFMELVCDTAKIWTQEIWLKRPNTQLASHVPYCLVDTSGCNPHPLSMGKTSYLLLLNRICIGDGMSFIWLCYGRCNISPPRRLSPLLVLMSRQLCWGDPHSKKLKAVSC